MLEHSREMGSMPGGVYATGYHWRMMRGNGGTCEANWKEAEKAI